MNINRILLLLGTLAALCLAAVIVLEYAKEISPGGKKWVRLIAIIALLALVFTFAKESLEREAETREKVQQAREELKKTQDILLAIRRTTEKIEKLQVSYDIIVNASGSEFIQYREWLEKSLSECLVGEAALLVRDDPNPLRVQYVAERCWPNNSSEAVVQSALSAVVVHLDFYKNPAKNCALPDSSPDATAELSAALEDGDLRLAYDHQGHRFFLSALGLEQPYSNSKNQGAIVAPLDLARSQLVVGLKILGMPPGMEQEIYKSLELRTLVLSLLGPHSIECPLMDELKRIPSTNGYPKYAYCFGPEESLCPSDFVGPVAPGPS